MRSLPLIRSRWTAIAAGVVLTGLVASWATATAAAHQRESRSRHAFEVAAGDVAHQLDLTLQREQDVAVMAAAELLGSSADPQSSLESWVRNAKLLQRYSEVRAVGAVRLLSPVQVRAMAARIPGGLTIQPAGARPFYCLGVAGVSRPSFTAIPAGTDFCADDSRRALLSSRDSAMGSYWPFMVGDRLWLGVQTPYYKGGKAPHTLDERRAALVGWAGMIIDPHVILERAKAGHPLMAELRHKDEVLWHTGRAERNGQADVTPLGNGWSVRITGEPLPQGVLSAREPLATLLGGSVISALLGLLVLQLGTGRARALRLVEKRTGELRHLALHDSLTGLPNRALVMDRIQQALARAQRNQSPLAVMLIDLDGFKAVNDTYGHPAGDVLLQAVSSRLSVALRDTDTIARLGGDEFVVLAEGASLSVGPEAIAERIQAVLHEPFLLEGPEPLTVKTHASIGIAVGLRENADDLLRDADVALYEAKAAGKDRFVLFAPSMQTAVQDRLELENDLRSAIGTDQLHLVYQPTLDLRTEQITGVEALLRWSHPTRGMVMPDAFIPLAEETSLIVPIGRQVLFEACRQVASWQEHGAPLSVAVNVSGRQLDSPDLIADVRHALAESGLEPSRLTLEITETMLMRNTQGSAKQLQQLKEVGVRVAIDDFGTGYCSLAYLQQFPVDALKIDRSFINGIASSPEANALIHTLVQLGKSLGIETYAEGIEERSQLQHLQDEQCDSGQGYLFSRPVAPEAVEELLRSATPQRTAQVPLPRGAASLVD